MLKYAVAIAAILAAAGCSTGDVLGTACLQGDPVACQEIGAPSSPAYQPPDEHHDEHHDEHQDEHQDEHHDEHHDAGIAEPR